MSETALDDTFGTPLAALGEGASAAFRAGNPPGAVAWIGRRRTLHSVFRSGPGGRLAAEGMCLDAALAEAGAGTPAYVYSSRAVVERFAALQEALAGSRHLVAVALKANALPALLTPLRDLGAGVEAVSAAELLVADGLGFAGDRIVMSGVGKTTVDLETALDLDVRFVSVESRGELELLNRVALRRGRRARALLRLNPEVDAATHPKIATGTRAAKFGMAAADLLDLASASRDWRGVEVLGVHAHVGSQIRDLGTLARSAERLARVFGRLRAAGLPVRVVDVGGGLGIPQRDGEEETPMSLYASRILGTLREVLDGECPEADPTVVFEPGRALFGPAGALVVRVLHTKRTGTREFCVVDGGMNDFLRPALYGAWHRVAPVEPRPGPARSFDVVGGVCESGDAFARDRALPPPVPGDLLAVLDAGAYGYSMASNVNLRPRPAEVVIRDGAAILARPAETPADLAARELGAQPAGVPA
ncbi:MAG: diaminopimelate decarboxylase [Acidobacteria bacterium]|nr:diaminopimelate decarboxylase [Acidobacteriota bacterium]MYE42810.1 diaminopimelate decarboxylase [Acidobacteriota bacterium]